jgi:lipopolysaccharide transport system permease protein
MNNERAGTEQNAVPTVVIRGTDSGWTLRAGELWQHRELLYFLAMRDIKVRYKQTVLGFLWAILQPLGIALTLTLFLGRFVQVPSGGLPYLVFAYSAMTVWQLFANALTNASNSLPVNERLISKVYFPRLLVPVAAIVACLPDFVVSLAVLAVFLVHYQIALSASLWMMPVAVLLALLIAVGAGLWLATLNVRYRDVRHIVSFLVQFWFFATPVAYPVSVVPERWRAWYGANPMVGAVEAFRWSLHGTGPMPLTLILLSAAIALALVGSGLYYFRQTEDTFADFI